jgi:hypothetical protein
VKPEHLLDLAHRHPSGRRFDSLPHIWEEFGSELDFVEAERRAAPVDETAGIFQRRCPDVGKVWGNIAALLGEKLLLARSS